MTALGRWMGVFAIAGCAGNIGSESAARTWALETDGNLAFFDPAHPEYGTYANPFELLRLEVVLRPDGTLCATDGEAWERCGGPFDGIPYTARAHAEGDKLCLDVVDVRGNHVESWCHERIGEAGSGAPASSAEPTCRAATTAAGESCSLCTDAGGTITLNTCATDDSTIDELGGATDPSDCASPDGAVRFGAGLFAQTFNEYMDRIGLDLGVDASRLDLGALTGFDEGEISLESPDCADIVEYRNDEFEDDLGDPEDDAFGERAIRECLGEGDCRIGQLVTRAMVEACGLVPAGCNMHRVSMGVIAAGGETAEEVCDDGDSQEGSNKDGLISGGDQIEDCVGSPLVLDLAGDGLSLSGPETGARFALFGTQRSSVGWLAGSDDALLAMDIDGDFAITSGRELFGEGTGGWAPDGFAALARADANGDGVVDLLDPAFSRLLVWADDGDGISQAGELRPLVETGISSLPLAATRLGSVDRHGNQLGLAATAFGSDGRGVPIVDVWFRLGR
ncbi:MAG: hypothetical protein HYY06_24260 [Deltaproteobacteria bacterium]|nr:hypothetical protein [Deltaproteobacteria bacterium]